MKKNYLPQVQDNNMPAKLELISLDELAEVLGGKIDEPSEEDKTKDKEDDDDDKKGDTVGFICWC